MNTSFRVGMAWSDTRISVDRDSEPKGSNVVRRNGVDCRSAAVQLELVRC